MGALGAMVSCLAVSVVATLVSRAVCRESGGKWPRC